MPVHDADDRGDVVLVDLLLDHRVGRRVALLELLLERGQLAVADLGDALEVSRALGPLRLAAQLVDPRRDLADPIERGLLFLPACGQLGVALLRLGQLALDRLAHVLRLLPHCRELDLELPHGPLRLVELQRRALDLHLQP